MNNENLIEYYIEKHLSKSDNTLHNQLFELYKVYSTVYIHSLEDLIHSNKNYCQFLCDNIELFDYYPTSREEKIETFKNIKYLMGLIINRAVDCNSVDKFVNTVNELIPSKHIHLLDVGSGQIPYSSILFGQNISEVTTMDNSFVLSLDGLKNLNVNGIEKFFKLDTPIEQYDMVVGSAPCSAIDSIVYLCNKYKKPYYIVTCDCCLPTIHAFKEKYKIQHDIKRIERNRPIEFNDEMLSICGDAWQPLLTEIDKDVKFCGDIAFNLDASEDEIRQIIKANNGVGRTISMSEIKKNIFAHKNLNDEKEQA